MNLDSINRSVPQGINKIETEKITNGYLLKINKPAGAYIVVNLPYSKLWSAKNNNNNVGKIAKPLVDFQV